MGRIYLPFEDHALRPTFAGMLPGTPPPVLVGNPMLRGGPFVGLPGYGMEAAEAGTNLVVDPDFPDETNWSDLGAPTTTEVGPQFAMDQGEFLRGLHIVDADGGGKRSTNFITISASTDYIFSFWVYVLSGILRGSLLEFNAAEELLVETNTASWSVQRGWHRIVLSKTSEATAAKAKVDLETPGATAGDAYFWMPQLETGTYAKPARVGAQPASCIYTRNFDDYLADTQSPWSALCVVTPDWDYNTAQVAPRIWNLYEDTSNELRLYYSESADKWQIYQKEAASGNTLVSAVSAHSRGDKVHAVVTCDGYNLYLYINGVQTGPLAVKSIQPITLAIGSTYITAGSSFNGVVDDFAFIEGAAIPEFRVAELYRASLRGVPLHGVLDQLA